MSVAAHVVEAHGARIPLVGLGTWELRGRVCTRIVEQALRLGYRHVDTAEALRQRKRRGGGAARRGHRAQGSLHHHQGMAVALCPGVIERSAQASLKRSLLGDRPVALHCPYRTGPGRRCCGNESLAIF